MRLSSIGRALAVGAVHRRTAPLIALASLLVLVGCSAESPTVPELDAVATAEDIPEDGSFLTSSPSVDYGTIRRAGEFSGWSIYLSRSSDDAVGEPGYCLIMQSVSRESYVACAHELPIQTETDDGLSVIFRDGRSGPPGGYAELSASTFVRSKG